MFSWFWFSFYLFFLGKNLEKIPSVFVDLERWSGLGLYGRDIDT